MKYINSINFGAGLVLGSVAVIFYQYDTFLYYTVFAPMCVIWYLLINAKVK